MSAGSRDDYCQMMLDAIRRQNLIDAIAGRVERFNARAPAILFLEAYKPLAFLGAQMLWAAQPILNSFFAGESTQDLALLFEDPSGIEQLIERLEKSDGQIVS